ncbi:hypothetical protein BGX31_004964 [Mortierella sp. GBA43]|nr:hypothetical protein BGX31_004964 [Mortierella sp. GBA43]
MGDNNYYEHPASEEEPTQRWKGNGRTPDAYFESGPQPWAFEKKIYEWREDYADGGAPADEKLEEELYGEEGRITAGIFFDEFSKVNVSRKGGPENYTPLTSKHGIPLIMAGYDLLACSQTGSGKTAAFLLPILSKTITKLARAPEATPNRPGERRSKAAPMVLIISPTRELAIQIFDETRRFTYQSRVRPAVVYGGAELRAQKELLSRGCDVLIATPGRLVDSMERGALALGRVKYLVLDEADRILDQGFEPIIRQVLFQSDLPRDEGMHTMMFSATFPDGVQVLARDFMKDDYCRLRIGRIGGTSPQISQNIMKVEDYNKEELLMDLLCTQPPSRTMIFVSSKKKADHLDDVLYNRDFPCISLHGDRNQQERELALQAFKSGRSPILIATSLAARGLDIKDVLHVVNFDLCDDIDEYVHRIGRTARAGNPGLATSFYTDADYLIGPQLTKLLVECNQSVPDFLKEYMPDVENISYENDFVDPDTYDIGALAPTSTDGYGYRGNPKKDTTSSQEGTDNYGYRTNPNSKNDTTPSQDGHDSYGYRSAPKKDTESPKDGYDNYGYRSAPNKDTASSQDGGYDNFGYRNTPKKDTAPSQEGYDNHGYRNTPKKDTASSQDGFDNHGYRNTPKKETASSQDGFDNYGYRGMPKKDTASSQDGFDNHGYRSTPKKDTASSQDGFDNHGYRSNPKMDTPASSDGHDKYGYRSSSSRADRSDQMSRSSSGPGAAAPETYDNYGYRVTSKGDRPDKPGFSSPPPHPDPKRDSMVESMSAMKVSEPAVMAPGGWDSDPLKANHRQSTSLWSAEEQAAINGWSR